MWPKTRPFALILLTRMQVEAAAGKVLAPRAGVAMSPWTDLTLTGASMIERAEADPLLTQDMLRRTALIISMGNPEAPSASPLYGSLANLPPIHIHVVKMRFCFDDSRRYVSRAQAAGSDVSLNVWQGMAHVFPGNVGTLSAAGKALDLIGGFLTTRFDLP